jgi:hypothetical protein
VNPETGALHVLVDRKGDDGVRWWLAEIASWGKGAKQIAVGSIGDKALALARHPDMVAVCGAKKVATDDLLDAFAVLVRPGQDGEERLFDYEPTVWTSTRVYRNNSRLRFRGRHAGDGRRGVGPARQE